MRIARGITALAIAVSATVAVAPSALAQSDADINQARALGYQGQDALDKKDFKKAEDSFRKAHQLYPAAVTLSVGLARALAAQKKYVEAAETYNRVIREGVQPNASQAFKDALEAAKKEIEDVSPKIAKVTITVKDAAGADVASPKVTIDGDTVNAAGLGAPRPTDPGDHKLTASAEGYKAIEKPFSASEGQTLDLPIVLEKDANAVVTPPDNNHPPDHPPDRPVVHGGGGGSKVPAIVAFGIGGAGLIFGGVTGVLAMSKHSDLDSQCKDGKCGSNLASDVDSYHTMGTLSTVGFIVAGVGAGAGLVLWLTSGSGSGSVTTRTGVVPVIGPGSIGAFGRF